MTNQRGNRLLETQPATMFCVEIAETMEQRQRQGELMKNKALKERNIFLWERPNGWDQMCKKNSQKKVASESKITKICRNKYSTLRVNGKAHVTLTRTKQEQRQLSECQYISSRETVGVHRVM